MKRPRIHSPFTTEVEREVWHFVDSRPGSFIEENPEAVYRAAWGASGLQMSCSTFTDTLHVLNFRPEPLPNIADPNGSSRDKMAQFILRFPSLHIVGGGDYGEGSIRKERSGSM